MTITNFTSQMLQEKSYVVHQSSKRKLTLGVKGFMGEGKHSTDDRNRKAFYFCQMKFTSKISQKFKDHIEQGTLFSHEPSLSDQASEITQAARSRTPESSINYLGKLFCKEKVCPRYFPYPRNPPWGHMYLFENGVSVDVVNIDNDQLFSRLHTIDNPDAKFS